MTYLEAAMLGMIQGLTEFLPVSSSGHLVVARNWLSFEMAPGELLVLSVVTHLGTLLAIPIVFWKSIVRAARHRRYTKRILWLAAMASLATAGVVLPFKEQFEALFEEPRMVGWALILTGILLYITENMPRPRKGWRQLNWLAAIVIGLAQAITVIPGLSRSGSTICAAMLLGLRRRWAAEFSFLIAAPTIIGATILELGQFISAASSAEAAALSGPLLLSGIMAFVVGVFALRLLLHMLRQSRLQVFSYYVWALGAVVILWG